MPLPCSRLQCDRDAVALCAIDPPATTVLLLPVDATVIGSALCERHTERLRPPGGWQLRDERHRVAPSPVATPPPEPRRSTVGLDDLLDARSPLLSRAFRTAAG